MTLNKEIMCKIHADLLDGIAESLESVFGAPGQRPSLLVQLPQDVSHVSLHRFNSHVVVHLLLHYCCLHRKGNK